jgi:hypothetical protein
VRGNVVSLPPTASVSDVSPSECLSIKKKDTSTVKHVKLLCTSTRLHAVVTTLSHVLGEDEQPA